MKNLTSSVSVFALSLPLLAGCGGGDSSSLVTGMPTGHTPTPLAAEIVGTSAPGDVWSLSITNGQFTLTGDNGTPANTADDYTASGTAARSGASVLLTPVGSDDPLFQDPFYALSLPGFGYVLPLAGRAIAAIDRGPCNVATDGDYHYFPLAQNTRPDGQQWGFDMQIRGGVDGREIVLQEAYRDGGNTGGWEWTLSNVTCASDVFTVGDISTPFSRDPGVEMYEAPAIQNVFGAFSSNGTALLDFGRGFGGVVAVASSGVPSTEADTLAAYARVRNRILVGYAVATHATQATGEDWYAVDVQRGTREKALRVEITMGDGFIGSMRMFDLDGTMVAEGLDIDLAFSDGQASVRVDFSNASGSSADLNGALITSGEDLSIVAAGLEGSGVSTTFNDALAVTLGAGEEIWRTQYAMYLRFLPPRDCFEPGTSLPDVYASSLGRTVPSMLGRTYERIEIEPVLDTDGELVGTRRIVHHADNTIEDYTNMPAFLLVDRGAVVQGATTDDYPFRVFCGPSYPWNPGQDALAATTGFATSATSGFTVPGTYIIEVGPASGSGGGSSQYVVLEVR